MKTLLTAIIMLSFLQAVGQESKETQIKAAVQAAPENMRDGAKVYGFVNGEFQTLREGSNKMICIADDPSRKGYNLACYHADLDEFMNRGRQLRKEGVGFKEIFEIREKEVKSGTLNMPERATLHILSGADGFFNKETNKVEKANYRWVIYIPYSTAESTGLPLGPPFPGAPWLMDPGTHRAHIMVTPPPPPEDN